ncbi:MAG: M28 family peptidase [Candidatus Sigynarchaeum springense]
MVETDTSYRKYMYSFIEDICNKCGPRRPASEAERKAQDMIKAECETFADEVKVDEFRTAYNAYPGGLVRVAVVLMTISFGVSLLEKYWYALMFAFIGLALWVIVAELMVMLEFTDPFYKKDVSRNVFGVVRPRGETRLRIIFAGHSDSAYEIPFARKYGARIITLMMLAIGYGVVVLGLQVLKLVLDLVPVSMDLWTISGIFRVTIVDAVFLLSLIIGYPFILWVVKNAASRSKIVLGANDNLSGVAAALALGKHFKEHRPKHVEVWAGAFGCEEAGQRGSRRFVSKYGPLGVLDNAYTVVLESISGVGFGILSAEKMYLTWPQMKPVYHSKELVDKFFNAVEIYRKEKGAVPYYRIHEATFAGTDATRFSQKGYKAIALASGGENMFISNWHDESDVPKNINKLMLWHAINMCATFVDEMDKEMESKKSE